MVNDVSTLVLALLGAHVVVTLAGNRRYEGILVGATGTPDVSLAIRNARSLDTPAAPPVPTLLVLAKDLLQLDALDVNLRPPPPDRVAFKTDTDITGAPPTTRGKPLEAWSGEDYTLGNDALESNHKSSNSTQNWDQFATNERLYGVRTDYNEDAYTTKLDRTGSNFRQREQKAAQLEREILRGTPDYNKLVGNAHMAEERGFVDDSGLDEEDRLVRALHAVAYTKRDASRYGAVIRGVEAYVPPGARKTPLIRLAGPPGQSATPSPPSSRAPSREPKVAPVVNGSPRVDSPVVNNFRQFVSDEKERLSQKKQGIIKLAERKDKDSRIASLVEFSQNFKLKGPIPADLAEIIGKDSVKKLEAKVAAAAKATPASVTKPRIPAASSTLIAEIPPFNPSRNKPKPAESVPVVVAPAKTLEPVTPSKKISANAPAFVFRPGASSFTPSVSSAVSSPASQSVALPPANPFFGNTPIKKGSPSMHVKEDFTPFKSGVAPEPSSVVPSFPFTGRPYRAAFPGSPTPPPPPPEDEAGLPLHLPPPPPHPQGYPMYPPQYPPNFRFQQLPPQHQQLPHLPPQQQNPQFHYPPPMQFPQQGMHAGPGPGYNPIHQQGMRFGQFPPPPPPNGPPLNFVEGGRPMGP